MPAPDELKAKVKEYLTKNNYTIGKDGICSKNGTPVESGMIINELCRRNVVTINDLTNICFGV